MQIVYNEVELTTYMRTAVDYGDAAQQPASGNAHTANKPIVSASHPILIDRFLEDATEVDVDCISDGETTVIGAIMEHIEEAGIHSGDSACVIPPFSLSNSMQDRIRDAAKKLAKALNVRGLMNMQLAVKGDDLYVIEVNPRASRTAPFVSKAIGVPLPKLAAKIMAGKTLKELGFTEEVIPKHHSVKEAVFPFSKFTGVDIILGPEMKSTGEVMGTDEGQRLHQRQGNRPSQRRPHRQRLRRPRLHPLRHQRHRQRHLRGRHRREHPPQTRQRPAPQRHRPDEEQGHGSGHQHPQWQKPA
jgi:carbamoyl-phosphate synthase large subunit